MSGDGAGTAQAAADIASSAGEHMGEAHRWRAPWVGERRELELAQGRLEYFERGDGPVLVFAHGWLANANLWRKVVEHLATGFRCVTLDLPLGAHRVPMADGADLTPQGCGKAAHGRARGPGSSSG